MRRLRAAITPARVLLGLILVAGLALRLWHNGYGLPYVYNVDEGSHFSAKAIGLFRDANPGYFQNPSAYTYLLHALLRFKYGGLWPFGDFDHLIEQYRDDPSAVYDTARSLAAVICMAGVAAVFFVARRLWGAREAVVAAALLAFAFLPVTYSRIAVTDVGTLAPVAIAVYGAIRAHETGARRWFALAGAAAGLAVGFKYTAGLVALPVGIAGLLWLRRDARSALAGMAIAAVCATAAFFVTTPYFFLDFDTAWRQIEAQAEMAGDYAKLGQAQDNGFLYYLDTLTWGLGWVALVAAGIGFALVLRRDRVRALLLGAFPIALFVYLAVQSRYFGRWLLPIYPVLVMLAGVALVRAAELVRGRPRLQLAALGALLVVALAQPVAADVRTGRLLGRTDTRELAREWLRIHYPPRLRAIVEPAVPARWYRLSRPGRRAPLSRKQFVRGFAEDVAETRIDYAATLTPERIDLYREHGFCVVVTMSVIRGRAENDEVPEALAYYERLEREAELLKVFSPFAPGADEPPFHFDLSYNYYPTAYERPGPVVKIYELRDCEQQYGPVPEGVGTPEVAKR